MSLKHEVDKSVEELAKERIRVAYERFDTIVVAFSGGKDSTAALNYTIEVARELDKLPVKAYFIDEELIEPNTIAYVERVREWDEVDLDWYCLPVKHRNACSRRQPWYYPWNPDKQDVWLRDIPEYAITTVDGFEHGFTTVECPGLLFPPDKYGLTGVIFGIRTQESFTRYLSLVRREHENYISYNYSDTNIGNVHNVYPIYDFKTNDIWLAHKKNEWDYNRNYDLLNKFGLTPYQQRVSTPLGEQPLQIIHSLKKSYPEWWNKLIKRVPGVATAGRYSQTELYGNFSLPEKPKSIKWKEFIKKYIKKFNPKDQKRIASRVKNFIERHYKITQEPILRHPHPETGVSWRLLLRIAVTGDFKDRLEPGQNLPKGRQKKVKENYYNELDKVSDKDGKIPDTYR